MHKNILVNIYHISNLKKKNVIAIRLAYYIFLHTYQSLCDFVKKSYPQSKKMSLTHLKIMIVREKK